MFVALFKTLVRPHLEYASPTWAPLYKKDKNAIENVQRRATRFVIYIKHKDYSERLKALGLPTLEYRRERADMVEVYNILHNTDKVDKLKLFYIIIIRIYKRSFFEIIQTSVKSKCKNWYVQQPCGGSVEFFTRNSCNGTLPQQF